MSIFDKIADTIFGPKSRDKRHRPEVSPSLVPPPADRAPAPTTAPAQAQPQPHQTGVVNIENSLDSMPGADRLNWRTSIVDLMKLIGVDSDYESRKALAAEMGRTHYKGDAEDNVWLHKRVMQELANNGGSVPESLR
ncbi:MAG TPA: DUF3597 domain-containing protein [Qipengyuania sp.]|nr:DUF3597 domain-containing protein [Qipengyuania sp.]